VLVRVFGYKPEACRKRTDSVRSSWKKKKCS